MYMKDNKEFQHMMKGNYGTFTQYELWSILSNQNELGINTISIQKSDDKKFICQVDKITIETYLNNEESQS